MKSADKTRMSNTLYTKSFARKAGGFFNSLFLPDVCCICGDIIKNFEDVPKKIKFRGINGKCFDSPYCEFCTRDLERALGPGGALFFRIFPMQYFCLIILMKRQNVRCIILKYVYVQNALPSLPASSKTMFMPLPETTVF